MDLPLKRLDPGLPFPTRANQGDAGLDLPAAADIELAPGARCTVATGLAVAIPEGHVGLVVPRSGLAARHGISIVNAPGVIDQGFRGEVRVVLVNLGGEPVKVLRGERIAQLLVVPLAVVEPIEVDDLSPTERGEGGFGSSGR